MDPNARCYMLIQVQAGRTAEAVRALHGVIDADLVDVVQGAFDLVARIDDERAAHEVMTLCQAPPFIRALPCRVNAPAPAHGRRKGVST